MKKISIFFRPNPNFKKMKRFSSNFYPKKALRMMVKANFLTIYINILAQADIRTYT